MTEATTAPSTAIHAETTDPTAGIRARVLLSILGPVAWISFTLLYVAFWAQGFTLFQSIVVILVSLVILAGILGATWASFGMRRWGHWREHRFD